MKNNTWLISTHIAGVKNTEADKECRIFNARTESTLKRGIFKQMTTHWGIPEIDLFASGLNAQLPKFVSWKPDLASFVFCGCLYYELGFVVFYAFPPFCQIHRCLRKISEEKIPQEIMILPHWPIQVWWPQLLRMIIAIPFVLPKDNGLRFLPHSPQTLYPFRARLLSGNPSRIKEF